MRNKMPLSANKAAAKTQSATASRIASMPFDKLARANMKTMKDHEMHTFNSLVPRLNYRLSRQTLAAWVRDGVIIPSLISEFNRNKHLLFPTKKLDQLQALLDKAHDERVKKIASNRKQAGIMKITGIQNAKAVHEANNRRRQLGREELPEPNPAANDDDAIGRRKLFFAPQVQKLFSGYGLYR